MSEGPSDSPAAAPPPRAAPPPGRPPAGRLDLDLVRPRAGYHHPAVPAVFLWSEKAGCTSLLQWFLAQTGELAEATAHGDWIHDWEHEVMKARDGYLTELLARLERGDPVLKLVRDPFHRAVTQYLMMLRLGDDSGHFTVPIRGEIRRSVHGRADTDASFSFEEYLGWLVAQDPDGLNPHLAPQTTELERTLDALGRPVELIRLEAFADDLRAVERRFDLPPVDLDAATTSTHHTARRAVADATPDAVVRLRPPVPIDPTTYPVPPTELFFTPATVDLIAGYYAEDVARYGYAPPVVDRRPRPAPRHHVYLDVPHTGGATVRRALLRAHTAGERAEVDGPADTIAVVREPRARVWSWWHGVRDDPSHPLHDRAARGSLAALVGDPDALALDNGQVRLLSGVGDDVGFGELTEEHLQLAELRVLDPDTVVGVTEELDATLVALAHRYGGVRIHVPPTDAVPDPPAPAPADLAVIDATNRLDRRLHATAARAFHERWAAEATTVMKVRRRTLGYETRVLAAAGRARRAALTRFGRGR